MQPDILVGQAIVFALCEVSTLVVQRMGSRHKLATAPGHNGREQWRVLMTFTLPL
jgi:hypothetical protein